MPDDDIDALARLVPEIVRNEPRYQQATYDDHFLWQGPPEPPTGLKMPIWHLDGVDWADHPAPARFHRHWPQTVGHVFAGETHFRCPCGAHGAPGEPWITLGRRRRRSWT